MKKLIVFFKENKEIIILIPTLLGGLYQILNIVILVGMPYVRYFSVSQVIPDGLLISITIFWIYVVFKIIFSIYKDVNKKSENQIEHSFLFNAFYILLSCSFGAYFIYLMSVEKDFSTFGSLLMRYAAYAVATIFIWAGIKHFLTVTSLDNWIKSKCSNINADLKDFLIKLLIIICLGILIRLVPNEIAVINEIFIKVNNFENYSSFSKEIQKTYNMKLEPQLLYINKDYAFFKITDEEEKILIVDAKSLTEIKKINEAPSQKTSIVFTVYKPQ